MLLWIQRWPQTPNAVQMDNHRTALVLLDTRCAGAPLLLGPNDELQGLHIAGTNEQAGTRQNHRKRTERERGSNNVACWSIGQGALVSVSTCTAQQLKPRTEEFQLKPDEHTRKEQTQK
jgi:hypothetical protein